MGGQQKTALHSKGFCGVLAEERKILLSTNKNQRLGIALDDLSLPKSVGDARYACQDPFI